MRNKRIMKKLLFVLIAILGCSFSYGQAWMWASQNINNTESSFVDPTDIVSDSKGNVYETGFFAGNVSFGSINFNNTDDDVYLIKYSKIGIPLWGLQGVNGGYPYGISVATNASGDVCLAGRGGAGLILGGHNFSHGGTFIAVFDSSGGFKWGISSGVVIYSVTMDNKGNVYAAGYCNGVDTIGTFRVVGSGHNSLLAVKIDNTGNVLWATTSHTNTFTAGNTVVVDTAGNSYVAGEFIDSLVIGSYIFTTKGYVDVFLSKFDPSGNPVWVIPAIVNNHAEINGDGGRWLSIDKHNDLYWSGWFSDSVFFSGDTLVHNASTSVPYLVKYSPAGNVLWAKNGFDRNGPVQPWSISCGSRGNIFLCGTFNDSIRFNSTTLKSDSGSPSFLFEFDSSGAVICATSVNNENDDENAVAADPTSSAVYLGGDFDVHSHNDTMVCSFGNIKLSGIGSEISFVAKWDCNATCNITCTPAVISEIYCNGNNTGSAWANPSGGTLPYMYLWSPGGAITDTVSGLSAGIYTVRVNDVNGCYNSSIVTITQPAALTDTIAIIASNECVCKKTLIAFPSGGTPPYTYLWSNSITTDTNLNVTGGLTYSVTITDSNGCTYIDSVTVPNLSIIVTTSQTNVLCYGESNGSASVVSPSGSGFYYTWAPGGQTTAGISGLSAGSYTVTVVDSIPSCKVAQMVTITQPPMLTVGVSLNSEVQCFGEDDGSASANPGGGIPAYTYHWSDGETNATATALPAGLATVIVTDANGCTASGSVTITQPPPLITSSNTNQGCGPLVEFQINASGGTPPYTYDWPVGFGNPGNYIQFTMTCPLYLYSPFGVTVYDANGCSSLVLMYFNTYLQIASVTQTNVTCYGGNNGSITVGLCGSGLLQYTITPGGTYSSYNQPYTYTNLTAGTYTISVENQLYCNTGPYVVTITQPPAIVVTTTVTGASCTSGGTATASASNGVLPYTYLWSNSQTTASISGLSMGTYTLNVTDNNGCTGSSSAMITQPPAISILTNTLPDNGSCNGSAWAIVSGGTVPYSYLWTGGLTTDTIKNQCAGNYCCTVSDSNGCIDSVCVTIPLILTTGISGLKKYGGITIFPNPSNGIFTLSLLNINEKYIIKIYDVLGQGVLTETLRCTKSDNLINLGDKPSGVYFYRVINDNGGLIGEGKFVINH